MRFLVLASIVLAIVTVAYIVALVYGNATNQYLVSYGAFEYKSAPSVWYMPEQLGIVSFTEHGQNGTIWLEVGVDPSKEPLPLQEYQPIFKYEEKFFQISDAWVTPGLPRYSKGWQIPLGIGVGTSWMIAGILILRERRKMV
jgi:hypothetical protein